MAERQFNLGGFVSGDGNRSWDPETSTRWAPILRDGRLDGNREIRLEFGSIGMCFDDDPRRGTTGKDMAKAKCGELLRRWPELEGRLTVAKVPCGLAPESEILYEEPVDRDECLKLYDEHRRTIDSTRIYR